MNNVFNTLLKPLLVKTTYSKRFLRGLEKKDAGVRRRAAAINQNAQDEDDLDFEANFFNMGKSHKQHEREMEAFKELQKYHIVKQKYFKEKLPNFLTWADKQQIKLLHRTDPETWTVNKLSEGFPAFPHVIQIIIKNDWVPRNINRVKRHDEVVQQNWHQFKTDKQPLKLPPDLVKHLNKFTSRDLNLNPDLSNVKVPDISKLELVKKGGEFSNIIQNYEALKTKKSEALTGAEPGNKLLQDPGNLVQREIDNKMHVIKDEKKKSKKGEKLLTYDELQKKVLGGGDETRITVNPIKTNEISSFGNEPPEEITLKPEEIDLSVSKFGSKSDKQINLFKPKRDYKNLMYPEKITIPADKMKRGCTYKLNDCFYDSDGMFLYRVPGMF